VTFPCSFIPILFPVTLGQPQNERIGGSMIKNYIKVAFRNMKKQKIYSFINMGGLAIGMACCILILLWVQDELNYDKFHRKGDRIYRLVCTDDWAGKADKFAVTPPAMAPSLVQDFPEIAGATRYYEVDNILVSNQEKKFLEEKVSVADPAFFEIFSFHLVRGNTKTALSDPRSVVLTESHGRKYFGDQDPLGKTLMVAGRHAFKVTGIMKDFPPNSHLQVKILFPVQILEYFGWDLESWDRAFIFTYVLLHPESRPIEKERLTSYAHSRIEDSENLSFQLLALGDIHLKSRGFGGVGARGDIRNIYIFSTVALFILLIACVNFMNLSTARSSNRAKEVGMRKVLGATRGDVAKRFFGESVLMALLALFLALVIVEFLLPVFNNLTAKNLSLGIRGNVLFYMFLLGIALATGLISGSYPAVFLSSFKPVSVLRHLSGFGKGFHFLFRKILVAFQFTLSIALIIGIGIVDKQLRYMQNKELGLNHNSVVCLELTPNLMHRYDMVKEEFLRLPSVSAVTTSSRRPFYHLSSTDWTDPSTGRSVNLFFDNVDSDYLKTFGIKIEQGRFFSEKLGSDITSYILNEEAVQLMGFADPIGKEIEIFDRKGAIIGVVADYHFRSLHSRIGGLVLRYADKGQRYLMARLEPTAIESGIKDMERIWATHEQEYPFHYIFMDDDLERFYRAEQRFKSVFGYFALLAVIISSLGLFGLAFFMAEKRTKEIGVRRILGASSSSIVVFLFKDFTKWVLVANLFAWPIAYFAMTKWLTNFAYKVALDFGIFLLASALTFGLAVLSVTYQSVKASLADPVDSLRYE
jgi:putative ABC transport system permease protein